MPLTFTNYKLMLIGLAIIVLGFVLMAGGGSDDPNVFNEEMFKFPPDHARSAARSVRLCLRDLRDHEETRKTAVGDGVLGSDRSGNRAGPDRVPPGEQLGHLQIFNTLFGLQGEENLTFAVAVHAATVCSTIVVFRAELGRLMVGGFFPVPPECGDGVRG